jgi:hypothetical protein
MKPQFEVPIRKFASLRTDIDLEDNKNRRHEQQGLVNQVGRPPPIILNSARKLKHLQKQLKGILERSFGFRSARNKTSVVIKEMANFQSLNLSILKNFRILPFPRNPENL